MGYANSGLGDLRLPARAASAPRTTVRLRRKLPPVPAHLLRTHAWRRVGGTTTSPTLMLMPLQDGYGDYAGLFSSIGKAISGVAKGVVKVAGGAAKVVGKVGKVALPIVATAVGGPVGGLAAKALTVAAAANAARNVIKPPPPAPVVALPPPPILRPQTPTILRRPVVSGPTVVPPPPVSSGGGLDLNAGTSATPNMLATSAPAPAENTILGMPAPVALGGAALVAYLLARKG